jgi:tRNA(Glu) U13 pseudouridine synthase TruD
MLNVTTTVFSKSIEKDKFHNDRYMLNISFYLPIGCYVTMLIK